MSRLFEALSNAEYKQPGPKPIPRAAAPSDVIQLAVRTVDVAPPLSAQELETAQFSPETLPMDVNVSDVPGPVFTGDTQAEAKQPSEAAAPAEGPSFEAAPALPAEELEAKQHSPEAATVVDSLFELTPPVMTAEETEQHSAEAALVDVSPFELILPLFAEETEKTEQDSPETVLAEAALPGVASPSFTEEEVASPLFTEEFETEQHSSEAALVDSSLCEVTPPLPLTESETVQLLDAIPAKLEAPEVVPSPPVERTEPEPHAAEGVPVRVVVTGMPSPPPAQQPEVELHLAEAAPEGASPSEEISAPDATPALPAHPLETESLSPERDFAEVVAPTDMTSPLSVHEAEPEKHSAEAIPVKVLPAGEVSTPDAIPLSSAPEARLGPEQQSADAVAAHRPPSEEVSSPAAIPHSSEQKAEQSSSAPETATARDSKPKPVERASTLPVVIRVPPESRLVALTEPNTLGAEKFRALVTRLEHLRKERELKCFQVTSSVIHEGKTLVSGNVAVTLAKYSGSKTLLIEGDLHRPTLASLFGLNNIRGLSHWWYRAGQDLGQFIYRLGELPLWFLPAGNPHDRPSDILRSARFVNAFAQLTNRFEWIVVDSTPMLPIVDVNLWSRLVDGTLLVVREGVTPVKALKQGLLALDHPKIIGVVLNDASETNESKYDGQYYGSKKR
jgi:capsular exopolysaccharide synthesis family protein